MILFLNQTDYLATKLVKLQFKENTCSDQILYSESNSVMPYSGHIMNKNLLIGFYEKFVRLFDETLAYTK